MDDAVGDRKDWAEVGVAGAAKANYFATASILLCRECEGGEGGCTELGIGGGGDVKVDAGNGKANICYAKRRGIGRCRSIFAWA